MGQFFKLSQVSTRSFMLLVATVLITSRLPTLFIQVIDSDEAVHSAAGWTWSNGGLPYINFADHKPPLQWFFYRLIVGPLGFDLRIVHAITILWVAATIWAIYVAVRPISQDGARWAALLYVFFEASYKWHDMLATNSEVVFNLPVALSLLFYIQSYDAKGHTADLKIFLAGVFAGIGFWIKPQAGIPLAVFGAHLLLSATILREKTHMSLSQGVHRLFWTVLGFVLVGLVIVLWAYASGFLQEMIYWTFTYNMEYISIGPEGLRYARKFLKIPIWMATGSLLAWIGCVLLFIRALRDSKIDHRVWIFILFVISVFIPVQMGRFYPHYFIQFYPGLFAAGGLGMAFWLSKPVTPKPLLRAILVTSLILPLPSSQIVGLISRIQRTDEEAAPYWAKIGHYIKSHTSEKDRIFVWGFASPIYYWSKRLPATRFLLCDTSISGYITGSADLLKEGIVPPISELVSQEDRRALLSQLEHYRPRIIVDTSPAAIHHFEHFPLATFPALEQWIRKNYSVETVIEGAPVYRLKTAARTIPIEK